MTDEHEDVVAMDGIQGPLIVRATKDAPSIRLALRRGDNHLVYATYERTAERDAEGRAVYRP